MIGSIRRVVRSKGVLDRFKRKEFDELMVKVRENFDKVKQDFNDPNGKHKTYMPYIMGYFALSAVLYLSNKEHS